MKGLFKMGESGQLHQAYRHRKVAARPELSPGRRDTEIKQGRQHQNKAGNFRQDAKTAEFAGKAVHALDGIDIVKQVSHGKYKDAAAKAVGIAVGDATTIACDGFFDSAEVLAATETGGASPFLMPLTTLGCGVAGSVTGTVAEKVTKPVIDEVSGIWHGLKHFRWRP